MDLLEEAAAQLENLIHRAESNGDGWCTYILLDAQGTIRAAALRGRSATKFVQKVSLIPSRVAQFKECRRKEKAAQSIGPINVLPFPKRARTVLG